MIKTLKEKIMDTLIKSQAISPKDLAEAEALHKEKGIPLDRALIEKGLIKEQDVLVLLVRELKIPFINLNKYKIDPSLKEIILEKTAREYNIIPLALLEKTLTIAIADPLNIFAIDDIKNMTGLEIDIVMSTQADILKALDSYYGAAEMTSITELSKEIDTQGFEIVTESEQSTDMEGAVDESEKAPIIRMINLVIKKAIEERASDIHMEPMIDCVRVRYRIDGVLRDILDIPKDNQNAVIVRIKIMSRLNITINQTPQDGRFKLKFKNKEVDFRVSILPTTFGQKIVMRILDKANLSVGLEGLGISPKSFEVISEAIRKPFGMILVTGPTGSGKSTTLYSIINSLNHPDKHIITVEDPVEYLVDGLAQIQARPEIGLTFAEGLRAILRQSPDIVMVGEIRDHETADIAIKASLTGQLVLSTLHTNDAAGAVTRLVDMGVEAFLVASSLILVTAQRLCRKICPHCKEPVEIAKEVLNRLHYPMKANTVFYQGKGCERCHQTGYLGRSSVTETLKIDDKVRDLLLEGKSSDQIKQYAKKFQGMNTLFDDAMQKCLDGITSLEEVLRITTME